MVRSATIDLVAKYFVGDVGPSKYLSGPKIIDFFNTNFGHDDDYGQGFPTRYVFAASKIEGLEKEGKLLEFFQAFLHEQNFIDRESDIEYIANELNKHLKFDNLRLVNVNGQYYLQNIKTAQVQIPEKHFDILSTEFMLEQLDKCERKVMVNDFDGAITNARSLIEEVLLEVEKEKIGTRQGYNGDLNALYKRVKGLINFDAGAPDLAPSLKQILAGLNSIIVGLSELRNKAGDSHAREYKPQKHHAELAVNCAKVFVAFVISSYMYQQSKICNT
jgi:hypothetical protein